MPIRNKVKDVVERLGVSQHIVTNKCDYDDFNNIINKSFLSKVIDKTLKANCYQFHLREEMHMHNKPRHAYLIIAHNNFYVLEKLLELLDYEYNDIFIHIDKKVHKFNFKRFQATCTKSNIVFTPKRIKVKWGRQSQIKAEMLLFETAFKTNSYGYYHLISGVDLPLKSQEEIHRFFDEQSNDNCYMFFKEHISELDMQRVSRYHYLTSICWIDNYLETLQSKLKINRLKHKNIQGW